MPVNAYTDPAKKKKPAPGVQTPANNNIVHQLAEQAAREAAARSVNPAAPSAWKPPAPSGPVSPGSDGTDTVVSGERNRLQMRLAQEEYLRNKSAGVATEADRVGLVTGNNALRTENALGAASVAKPRAILDPTVNEANARRSAMTMMEEARRNGEAGAANAFGERFSGQTPELRAATALSGLGMNPAAGIASAAQGVTNANKAFAQQGVDATGRQESMRADDLRRREAAAAEYARVRGSREAGQKFETDMTGNARTLARTQAESAIQEETARRAMAEASNDPAYIEAAKTARLNEVTTQNEGAKLRLDESRMDMELRRRDLTTAQQMDNVAEKAVPLLAPLANIAVEKGLITEDSDTDQLLASEQAAEDLIRRWPSLPPETQDAYRRRALVQLGNPSKEQLLKMANSAEYSLIKGIVDPLMPGAQKKREGARAAKRSLSRLATILFP